MKRTFTLFALVFFSIVVLAQKYGLTSPDGKLTAGIEIDKGIYVALLKGRNAVLRLGNISVENYYVAERNADFKVQKAISRSVSEVVKPEIRDKATTLLDAYNELEIRFSKNYRITFRLFNEGLAYRFTISEKDSLRIIRENLDLYFDSGDS